MSIAIREYSHYAAGDILPLYERVGWIAYTCDPQRLQRAYENSLLALAAYDGEKIIGIIRTVGDGETILLIQDLLVHPDYQRNGIGTSLMKAVLSRYGHVRQIYLVTDDTPETTAFYESLHFFPLERIGCRGFSFMK